MFKNYKFGELHFQSITSPHISDNFLTDANMISRTLSRNLREWVLERVASLCARAEGVNG
jgi:hypothetical protein